MKTFTINSENEVTALDSRIDAEQNTAPSAARFSSIEELAQVTQDWPLARLVAVWNGLPGLSPVSKFTDRRTAITRVQVICNQCPTPDEFAAWGRYHY